MRQKSFIILIIAAVCTLAITGCGSDSAAVYEEYPTETGTIETDEITQGKSDSSDIEESQMTIGDTVPTLDEIMEEVLYYADNEGMAGDALVINTMITTMYEEGYYDSFDIFNILCAEGYLSLAPVVPNGIIVLSLTSGSRCTWNSTGTYALTPFTLNLDCIDPDTGDVQHLRTFSSEDTHSCSMAFNGLGANAVQTRMHFNSDLTQVTATLTLEDGSVHVGWINENGYFTDVSEKVTAEAGDFGALTNHTNPCFGPGEYFYFRDSTNSNVQIKRVPLGNLTVSAVEIMIDNAYWNGIDLSPYPDGTIEDTEKNWYYYDENMIYPALGGLWGSFREWISPSECVAVKNNMIYKYSLSGNSQVSIAANEWYSDETALTPEINGRESWNPVTSPDASKVAFLSRLTTGTDTSPYLYVVSADGGEPVKVSTDYSFDAPAYYTYAINSPSSICLLTWE